MRVVLLVATERGRQFTAKMFELMPEAQFTVCSFAETPHEPPFLGPIRFLVESRGHQFIQTHKVEEMPEGDLLFAVSWRYIVPKAFYERFRLGAYVFHDSLLPAYRGFSPTVWAMMNGEQQLGASLIRMAEGVDEGDILDKHAVIPNVTDYIGDVMPRITDGYLQMIERTLPSIMNNTARAIPNERGPEYYGTGPTYCAKWTPDDARIDWTKSTRTVFNLIRATSRPYPGAFTFLRSTWLVRIWRVQLADRRYVGFVPGRVVKVGDYMGVVCGDGGVLMLTQYECDTELKLSHTLA